MSRTERHAAGIATMQALALSTAHGAPLSPDIIGCPLTAERRPGQRARRPPPTARAAVSNETAAPGRG